MPRRVDLKLFAGIAIAAALLSGCMAVTVAGAAVSVGATAVGVATDVAVGTAKVTGKAVGAAVDAVSHDASAETGGAEHAASPPPGPGGPRR